ncbi:MAG: hypothetical protein ACXWTY_00935 [Methylobacter sp.]
MTEDHEEIKIRYTLKQGKEDALGSETVHVFPVSRWKILLILVPAFIAAVFLSAFFFFIIFPLFLFGGIILGLWFWWLRRKLNKSNHDQSLKGEYQVFKETHIIETETDRKGDK